MYVKISIYFNYNCIYSFIFDRGCNGVSFELASPLVGRLLFLHHWHINYCAWAILPLAFCCISHKRRDEQTNTSIPGRGRAGRTAVWGWRANTDARHLYTFLKYTFFYFIIYFFQIFKRFLFEIIIAVKWVI